ncbi:hypothetical protein [Xanthomonas fragariae]|uniref:hypothetical protein n=1 Tax=Xanthomonas fragariae TaxID=48664 RepID=UPI0003270B9B|nr:hypothetical protein [Xanthomonas fragariae]AOD16151.1 hypothetical protein BER92_17520 [Xanthomonas fragariae]AOD19582.1 hypothetical protein BER93_17575 [Xanthomonas fragariae]ENZ96545.1 hypothetical protein O1K_04316 [Xanthomonas fragariae LMG 25863]
MRRADPRRHRQRLPAHVPIALCLRHDATITTPAITPNHCILNVDMLILSLTNDAGALLAPVARQ